MSSLFGGGGAKGLNPTQGFNIPFFASQGGITPEQQALADYTYGQGLDAQANLFGSSGTGASTMATQGAGGARMGEAQQEGQISDVNTAAEYGQYQNDVTNFQNTLSNTLSLDKLAQAAGGGGANISGFVQGGGFQNTPDLANL